MDTLNFEQIMTDIHGDFPFCWPLWFRSDTNQRGIAQNVGRVRGEKLKKIRLSKNLTQEYIANAADVNTSHISNIENNRVKVSLSVLVQICNALDTTVDYILSDEYNDSSSAIEQEILHELHSCNNETKEQILKIVKALQ